MMETPSMFPAPGEREPPPDGGLVEDGGKAKRQVLSCTTCRKRKVKVCSSGQRCSGANGKSLDLTGPSRQCDRVQPCQACCARGQPKDCTFAVSEKDDYEPIKQSYEIRELRKENLRLKEKLRKISRKASSSDDATPPNDGEARRRPPKVPVKPSKFQQRRFPRSTEPSESLYFGSPALANVVADVCFVRPGRGTMIALILHPWPKMG